MIFEKKSSNSPPPITNHKIPPLVEVAQNWKRESTTRIRWGAGGKVPFLIFLEYVYLRSHRYVDYFLSQRGSTTFCQFVSMTSNLPDFFFFFSQNKKKHFFFQHWYFLQKAAAKPQLRPSTFEKIKQKFSEQLLRGGSKERLKNPCSFLRSSFWPQFFFVLRKKYSSQTRCTFWSTEEPLHFVIDLRTPALVDRSTIPTFLNALFDWLTDPNVSIDFRPPPHFDRLEHPCTFWSTQRAQLFDPLFETQLCEPHRSKKHWWRLSHKSSTIFLIEIFQKRNIDDAFPASRRQIFWSIFFEKETLMTPFRKVGDFFKNKEEKSEKSSVSTTFQSSIRRIHYFFRELELETSNYFKK